MKRYFILIFAATGILIAGNCRGTPISEFLKQHNKASYIKQEKEISIEAGKCNWGNAVNDNVVPHKDRIQLFNFISKGNEYALRAGLLVLRCLDGADLEDFYESAGLFFDENPMIFLSIFKENKISYSVLKSALIMLPSYTTDNIDSAINVVNKRITALKAIDNDHLDELKKSGLSFLEDQKTMLHRIKAGENNKVDNEKENKKR